jgi:hypothetical protein
MKIFLQGHIPSKKNMLRRSKNGGMFRNSSVADQIDALTIQAKAAWRGREPLSCNPIGMVFLVTDLRSDIDNKATTVLDCLVKAGVLKNDNCKNGPHPQTIDWVMAKEEGVVIEL